MDREAIRQLVQTWRAKPPAFFSGHDLHELDKATNCREYTVENSCFRHHFYILTPLEVRTPLPVVFSFHGGGMVREHSGRDLLFCRRMALAANCAVISIDYSLSPEVVYPYAINESCFLIRYLMNQESRYGLLKEKYSLCGQSSGGNLAIATALRLRELSVFSPRLMVLCYSVFDQATEPEKKKSPCPDRIGLYRIYFDAYLDGQDPMDPLVSPVFALPEMLSCLPETLILDGGKDELKYENLEMVRKLADADVNVHYHYWKDSPHGFMVNQTGDWAKAQKIAFDALREALWNEETGKTNMYK